MANMVLPDNTVINDKGQQVDSQQSQKPYDQWTGFRNSYVYKLFDVSKRQPNLPDNATMGMGASKMQGTGAEKSANGDGYSFNLWNLWMGQPNYDNSKSEGTKTPEVPNEMPVDLNSLAGPEGDPGKLASDLIKRYGLGIGDPQTVGLMEKTQAMLDFENNVTKSVTNNVLMKYMISGGNFDELANLMVEKPQVSKGALDKKLATGPMQMPLPPIPSQDRAMLANVISSTIGNALKQVAASAQGRDAQYFSTMTPGSVAQSVAEMGQIMNTSLAENIKKRETIDMLNTELLNKYNDDVISMQADYEKRRDAAAWMYNQAKIQYANNAFGQAMQMVGLQGQLSARDAQWQMANKDIEKWNAAAQNQVNLARSQLRNDLMLHAIKASGMESKYQLPEQWKNSTKGLASYSASRGTPGSVGRGNGALDAVMYYIDSKQVPINAISSVLPKTIEKMNYIRNNAEQMANTPEELENFNYNYYQITIGRGKQFENVTPEFMRIMMTGRLPATSDVKPSAYSDQFRFIESLPDNPVYGAVQSMAMMQAQSGAGQTLEAASAQRGVKQGKAEGFFKPYPE